MEFLPVGQKRAELLRFVANPEGDCFHDDIEMDGPLWWRRATESPGLLAEPPCRDRRDGSGEGTRGNGKECLARHLEADLIP